MGSRCTVKDVYCPESRSGRPLAVLASADRKRHSPIRVLSGLTVAGLVLLTSACVRISANVITDSG
jgi:hypothetical protein